MAKAISNIERLIIDEETRRKENLDEIETAIADNKEAVLETITLIRHLHDLGLLELLNGLFSQGDGVLRIVVRELNKPENSRVLENGIGLAGLIGSLDVDRLKGLTEKMNKGLAEVTDSEADVGSRNVFQLIKGLKDPEINRSVAMLMRFLKGMGKE